MPLQKLGHVNLRTRNLKELTRFYTDILGMHVGPRPDFGFPGAWIYLGEEPIVHLVGVKDAPSPYREDQQLEHFAIDATGRAEFVEKLEANNVAYYIREIEDFGICQVNLHDTDGNHIHIDFPLNE